MILFDGTYNNEIFKETYIALGSFDGLHKGHLTLINKAIELSKENNCQSMVYTFKNHPLNLVNKDIAPKLIMDNKTKVEVLEKLGIDIVCLIDFTKEFMQIEPKDFVKMLLEKYNAKGLVVGFNYKFGHKNKGDVNLLKELSKQLGFELYIMKAYKSEEDIISSTKIRNLISNADIGEANEMLERKFLLRGIVVHGKKNGRTLGFPTANIKIDEDIILPKLGVYYTNVEYDKKIYKGITSVGLNPTFYGKTVTVETYILDFDKFIYGDELKVYFIERIRDNEKYDSLTALKEQLFKDKEFAETRKLQISL
ncbi:FMN adenylyltransferase [Clostridium cavendishii DSM 21758]|uniref:Riboflavin biosynthesis protein n=1 Tax=Clostridium cavendishii DSM 21758 TaxID=1121302 RepID=A0A1M6RMX0_9CLOT|nr:bifunctional riboflavin kinase/FAD synthetase [Clostridium cavendishii]SHK33786.1 FMN adenylyltransferase [Clostridium cavendishii DSM 21758]